MDAVLVPIVGEPVEHDLFLRDALDEAERPGADRLGDELVAGFPHGLRADHHAGAVGQLRDQRRERRLEQQADRERIGDLDLVDLRQLGPTERALHRHVPVERELRRFGVERLAVVEFHAWPQLDGDGLAVFRGRVRERELRHDVEIGVDVEQLVAHRGEHDAAHIGARGGRIEIVGILRETDAQMALREGGRKRHGGGQQGAEQDCASLHDDVS